MSRLRLKPFNPARKEFEVDPVIRKSTSTHASIRPQLKMLAAPAQNALAQLGKKMRVCRSRGSLMYYQLNKREPIAKMEDSKCKSPLLLEGKDHSSRGLQGRSRSPSYNELKKKRLMRDRKSRARLVHPDASKQIKESHVAQAVDVGGLERKEKKIKCAISKLESMLCDIQAQRQRTDRERQPDKEQLNSGCMYRNLTDRRDYKQGYCHDDSNKKTLRLGHHQQVQAAQDSTAQRKSLVESIIQKTKRQHKLVNLKEVRSLYKEMSPAKDIYMVEQLAVPDSVASQEITQRATKSRRSIRPYRTVSEDKQNEANNIHTIEQESSHKAEDNQPSLIEDYAAITVSQIRLQCSEIKNHSKRESFFSDPPSYLKPGCPPKGEVGVGTSNILKLVEMDSGELKRAFKSKQKKKLLEKWKRNFPDGFFEDVNLY